MMVNRICTLLTLALLATGSCFANSNLLDMPAEKNPSSAASPPPAGFKLPSSGQHVVTKIKERQLRCWQEGILIFEEIDWVPDAALDSKSARRFQRGAKEALYIFNFGDTFCVYRGLRK